MSIVTYQIGKKEYSFESCLQLRGIPLIAVEENLHEEVKNHIKSLRLTTPPFPNNITVVDDNGIIAVAKDFQEITNLKIVKQ